MENDDTINQIFVNTKNENGQNTTSLITLDDVNNQQ